MANEQLQHLLKMIEALGPSAFKNAVLEIQKPQPPYGSEKTFSTGVLRREPGTVSAVNYISNIGAIPENVTVEVWDWTKFSNPTQLPVYIGDNITVEFPYLLKPNNFASMYAPLQTNGVTFYEVRVIYSGNPNITFNSFGRNASLEAQEGDTVLQHQFKEVYPGR